MNAIFICVLILGLTSRVLFAAEFYVASHGNDDQPGTQAKPFASFERAQAALRQARTQPGGTATHHTVWIRGGDYIRQATLTLTAADSGTPGAPVLWRAFPGETVRWLGGRRITGFTPVTNAAVLARLEDAARGKVLVSELKRSGMTNFGTLASRGFGRPLTPAHCELFCGGKPMTLARWPNEGAWELIAGFPEGSGENDGHGGKLGPLAQGFLFQGERPARWRDTSDVWVHGYWAYDWANTYERVARVDVAQHRIITAPPHGLYGFRKGQRFYFLNLLEELDQPGEWFLDRKQGRLYFWPPADAVGLAQGNGSVPEVWLSTLAEPLLRITEASNVSVRGVVFEATRGTAIEIERGSSNAIVECILRNIGNYGVRIEGGHGHQVTGCDVFDTGDGGVSLEGGDRRTLTPAGHGVENCHFARQGRWSKCYVPAVLMNGVGLRAAHNLIHDHPHCAILFNGNDHLIEFNEIHHIALETGDVGAIYTGRDYTYRGNRIRHNFIHHTGGVGMGSMGVYMDDCVSGTEIYGNIFYRVQRAAFLGGGRDHQVLNNIFVECNHAVELDGRGLDGSPVWRGMVDQTMRQRLAEVPLALYRERYPALQSLDAYYGPPQGPVIAGAAFKGVPPEGNVVARNICVGKWLNVYWHAKPELLRLEKNLTDVPPRFIRVPGDSVKAADFALEPDSPARKMGFEKIPVERIGLQRAVISR